MDEKKRWAKKERDGEREVMTDRVEDFFTSLNL